MAKTRRELIDQVIGNLGILVPGQSPGDEPVSVVDATIDPKLAEDAALNIVYVADAGTPDPPAGGQIDDAVFLSVAHRVTGACAGFFNLANDPSIKVLHDQAGETLRTIGRPASTKRSLSTDFQLRGSNVRVPLGNFSRGT